MRHASARRVWSVCAFRVRCSGWGSDSGCCVVRCPLVLGECFLWVFPWGCARLRAVCVGAGGCSSFVVLCAPLCPRASRGLCGVVGLHWCSMGLWCGLARAVCWQSCGLGGQVPLGLVRRVRVLRGPGVWCGTWGLGPGRCVYSAEGSMYAASPEGAIVHILSGRLNYWDPSARMQLGGLGGWF